MFFFPFPKSDFFILVQNDLVKRNSSGHETSLSVKNESLIFLG